ncbi:MAG: DNA-binding protein [Deltaproteobacteria bacterium CG12_big_fil_rev_8_21_14_0_65_43_10]|nr:MAG: hypothetical protein AUK23_12635 [Deltaproteobacteria bacterium CG2_30_43_15]PIQ45662.1 MAG: DNA-binding protein [Deltaproteobacteria bacterium CG12_big_fil_rev_8_21_14_0_65_43_10]PIU84381.1 MAG: DNA-binding protein [Deltaproteobacteria bacterium CG06_land_8_20_14_3_00_44_19]PIZ19141.1 MAG: DNA-binding protein [Deltaproteobacteria bacterium CG_4_10_14_0_8_um_filter_43_12]
MTDKETLLLYRLRQAEETLSDARRMLENGISARSVTNRAYYSMFYALLALFIRFDVPYRTSKHSGVISIFDREFVHTGKLDRRYSKILHKLFDIRQECDYKEFVDMTNEAAAECIKLAEEFYQAIKHLAECP